ncbi:uncharacterized protein C19orf47 homolog isoform X9 [Macaca mulatta]
MHLSHWSRRSLASGGGERPAKVGGHVTYTPALLLVTVGGHVTVMAALSLVAAWWARAAAGWSVQLPAAPGSSVRARETMVSVTMATSEWIQFFKEAGIPPGPAVNYAVMFVDNRIQKSMLLDLNKEIMNELGVTVVGDIIAILKHAKVVHHQDMCKAATESVPCSPSPLAGEIRRGTSAASRMITNSLNHDSPPSTPPRRPDTSTSKISVTVSNKMAAKSAKATGLHRTSVFDRLGAETKADTTTGSKPTGVFSRLGATPETDEDLAWDSDNDSSSSVLQYAGVLKKLGRGPAKASPQPALTVKAKATSSATTAAAPTLRRLALSSRSGLERKPESLSKVSIIKRLGAATLVPEAQDSQVTSTKSKSSAEVKVTIKRTLVGPRGSSSSEGLGAQMDHAGTVSVFKRLGRRTF